jgi:NAD-dependent oxidoreductase involved in siderophore biosynthesis
MRTPVRKARLRAAMDALGCALHDAEHEYAEYAMPLRAASWAELCAMTARRWDVAAVLRAAMEHLAVSNLAAARAEFEKADAMVESGK